MNVRDKPGLVAAYALIVLTAAIMVRLVVVKSEQDDRRQRARICHVVLTLTEPISSLGAPITARTWIDNRNRQLDAERREALTDLHLTC